MEKLQTSIEFMVILAAVAGFSVFVLGLYVNLNHAQNSAYQGIMSYSQEKPNSISTNSIYIDNSTYLYASIQKIVYLNQSSQLSVVYSYPATDNLESISALASGPAAAEAMPSQYANTGCTGLCTLQFSVVPEGVGQVNVTVAMHLVSGTGPITKNITVYSYSTLPPGSGYNYTQYSLSINRKSEAIRYPVLAQANVIQINHYGPECGFSPLKAECNGYTWMVNDGGFCAGGGNENGYICLSASQTGYSATTFNTTTGTYNYSISVNFQHGGHNYTANLTSGRQTAPVYSGGEVVGYAHMNGVSGSTYVAPSPSRYAYLWAGTGSAIVSNASVSNYISSEARALSILNQYNDSGLPCPGCSGSWSDRPISWFTDPINNENQNASILMGLQPEPSFGCVAETSPAITLECPPQSPFYYNVTMQINGTKQFNTTAEYQGSVVYVR
jgi:hypothetical protein